ncbi:MAG TPA: glycosyltransferase family 1 protein, partial [Opitutus sp.]|nr:glycosyltransferase family 1 protein [Opitutus sp.]
MTTELAPELQELLRVGDRIAAVGEPSAGAFDVLYAPFGRSALMSAGVPTVSLIVDLLHRDLPAALPIEEINYRHEWFSQIATVATSFQCISHYTAERLQAHYGVDPRRCVVTHIPVHTRLVSTDDRAAAVPPPVNGPFFFYPANFWPHKNHATLLAAYRDYCDNRPGAAWPLVFTGHPDASMHALVAQAAAMGLDGRVRFLGHVSEDELVAVWRAAGALVYPSLHEGFGIPLLEAMAFGCPIIASNTTSMPEVGGDACEYVDPRDARSIAEALR